MSLTLRTIKPLADRSASGNTDLEQAISLFGGSLFQLSVTMQEKIAAGLLDVLCCVCVERISNKTFEHISFSRFIGFL